VDLTSASAIVTGGAGGFGSATVRRLAQMGAEVVIADVSDERDEALAREVGAGSLYVPTDCMDEDAIATAVKVAAGLGPLRAAVITHIGPDWPGGRGPARMLDDRGRTERCSSTRSPPAPARRSEPLAAPGNAARPHRAAPHPPPPSRRPRRARASRDACGRHPIRRTTSQRRPSVS
jgi:uncharacterized protein YbjT (DUF2867 family)